MHSSQTVVTITDNNKKSYREFNHNKETPLRSRCEVFLPFDSEYKIHIKNQAQTYRQRVEIEIDGTNVSGNGIIVEANSSVYIERFIDMAKKFKFVSLNNEAVSDPSNKENGIIRITVHKEKERDYFPKTFGPSKVVDYTYTNDKKYHMDSAMWSDNSAYYVSTEPMNGYSINNAPMSGSNVTVNYASDNVQLLSQSNGATIDGGFSSQEFTTTEWNGDSTMGSNTFIFQLIGKNESPTDSDEYKEYLRLKEKFGG